ncbi:hypothetical protein L226DRAFT_61850 [Lentinus tigrinus ALCF2SS1-7]|uniref:uncharacterized protein n=1 Tax=Lentinus tigrinus ALCF2SS1-7 TaxID=1328758 RepID=UPI001165EDA9|nr:hypothetical protein L226DRAFT_61850 [Lentinus tigrinus ALCF2SS1-7]
MTLSSWYLFQEALWTADYGFDVAEDGDSGTQADERGRDMMPVAEAVYAELVSVLRRMVVWPPRAVLGGWVKGMSRRFAVFPLAIADERSVPRLRREKYRTIVRRPEVAVPFCEFPDVALVVVTVVVGARMQCRRQPRLTGPEDVKACYAACEAVRMQGAVHGAWDVVFCGLRSRMQQRTVGNGTTSGGQNRDRQNTYQCVNARTALQRHNAMEGAWRT